MSSKPVPESVGSQFPTIFAVQPVGCAAPELPARRTLHYHFVDPDSSEGISVRVTGETTAVLECAVASTCRPLNGDFRNHALNRIVARELLGQRCAVLWLRGAYACVFDLARIARLMGVAVVLELDDDGSMLLPLSPWLRDCLQSVTLLLHLGNLVEDVACEVPRAHRSSEFFDALRSGLRESASLSSQSASFDYSFYEFLQRDQPLLMRMQAPHVRLFAGCSKVLDLGCGAGLFLQLLGEAGIPATGVERNPVIAEYGRGMGLDITTADALEFLEGDARFDGVYCSHFVEHLPIDGVERLLQGIARALLPGGVAVLVFPDPESIRSQLLGFWRDPEHVRFYHPELVETLAMLFGLELEWSSYDAQPHEVGPFALEPQALPCAQAQPLSPAEVSSSVPGWWSRAMTSLGFVPRSRVAELEGRLANMESVLTRVMQDNSQTVAALDERTRQLWAVNRTWAWSDNAVLKLRKRPSPEADNA